MHGVLSDVHERHQPLGLEGADERDLDTRSPTQISFFCEGKSTARA